MVRREAQTPGRRAVEESLPLLQIRREPHREGETDRPRGSPDTTGDVVPPWFLHKVWAIFEGATTEAEAQAKLAELKQYAAHHENDGYTKSIAFLDDNFKNMTTFLRVPGVQRNSLAESGMRVLRRLERNHDGFRSEKGQQNALKIYQAVMYLDWSIHNPPNLATSSG